MITKNNRYVTHIGVTVIPETRRKRLIFYTQTDESKKNNMFFLRLSELSSKEDFINNLITLGKIIPLKNPFLMDSELTMVWLDEEGKVFLGKNSEGKHFMKEICRYKELFEEVRV
jgi:hypothetical protein